jgi:uncharacterized protein (DUF4415 family)
MKKATSKALTPEQKAELKALADLPDAEIKTEEMPEQRDWRSAERGVFFRPIKKQLTIRLDADLIDWFKSRAGEGKGYQTRINKVLRECVTRERG